MRCTIYSFKEIEDFYLVIPKESDIKDIQGRVKDIPGKPLNHTETEINRKSIIYGGIDPVQAVENIEKQGFHMQWPKKKPYEYFCFIQCKYCRKTIAAEKCGHKLKAKEKIKTYGLMCPDCLKKYHSEVYKKYKDQGK